ncbi:MAG: hypothetical protein ACYTG5_23435, partial [Planctomycetota bacterium]
MVGTEKLVKYSLASADATLASFAYEQGRDLYEMARIAADSGEDSPELARALEGLGATMSVIPGAGNRQRALDHARSALDMYVRLGRPDRAIAVGQQSHTFGGLLGAVDFTRRALELSEEGTMDYGWLLARYAVALHSEDDSRYDQSLELLDKVVQIARNRNSLPLESRALVHRIQRHALHGNYELAKNESARAIESVDQVGDFRDFNRLASHLIPVAMIIGDTEWAEELLALGWRAAQETRMPMIVPNLIAFEMMLAADQGRWPVANDKAEEILERYPAYAAQAEANKGTSALATGRYEEVPEIVNRLSQDAVDGDFERPHMLAVISVLSSVEIGSPDLATALRRIESSIDESFFSRYLNLRPALEALLSLYGNDNLPATEVFEQLKAHPDRYV